MSVVDARGPFLALDGANVVLPQIAKELHLPLLPILGDPAVGRATQTPRQLLLHPALEQHCTVFLIRQGVLELYSAGASE